MRACRFSKANASGSASSAASGPTKALISDMMLADSREAGMRKQELESILGQGRNVPDLGPIEDHLHALATERRLPDYALGMCTIRIEESGPALRAVLTRA